MIDEIKRFVLVAKSGNLTKTAETIFITQSALSQSIKRLERNLDTKLFQQKGKTLTLTDDGKAMQAIGEQILSLWDKAQDPERRKITIPTYTIGAFDNAALRLGKYFQKTFSQKAFRIELTIGATDNLLRKLQLGICDIVVCVVDKRREPPSNTILITTFTEKLIPIAAKKYKRSFDEMPFIVYGKGSITRSQIDDVFTHAGISPRIFAESTSVTFMKELAILGCGVTLLPENFVKTELKQGVLQKLKLPLLWERTYGIYIQKHSGITKNHILLKEIINTLHKSK